MWSITEILSIIGLTGAFGLVFDCVGLYLTIRTLKAKIYETITSYINDFVADITAHPEKLQPFVDAMVNQGMKSLGQGKASGKAPMVKVPILGKVPLDMLMPFIEPHLKKLAGSATAEAAEGAVTSPFG